MAPTPKSPWFQLQQGGRHRKRDGCTKPDQMAQARKSPKEQLQHDRPTALNPKQDGRIEAEHTAPVETSPRDQLQHKDFEN
eukprot:8120534-Karenia_brevis.AAC.1